MRIEHIDSNVSKGWYAGPWNSRLDISVGYANQGVDEPHVHTRITEIYLVAHGTSQMRIEHETVTLVGGDMIVVDPGEAHTFLQSSADYLHFVIHTPGLSGAAARTEKQAVPRTRLGLVGDQDRFTGSAHLRSALCQPVCGLSADARGIQTRRPRGRFLLLGQDGARGTGDCGAKCRGPAQGAILDGGGTNGALL
jgi:mannose-6-phosphate isomerase-like protein (cupin superfamily)